MAESTVVRKALQLSDSKSKRLRRSSRRSSILKTARPLDDIQNLSVDGRVAKNRRVSFSQEVKVKYLKHTPVKEVEETKIAMTVKPDDVQISTPISKKRRRISEHSQKNIDRLSIIPSDFEIFEDEPLNISNSPPMEVENLEAARVKSVPADTDLESSDMNLTNVDSSLSVRECNSHCDGTLPLPQTSKSYNMSLTLDESCSQLKPTENSKEPDACDVSTPLVIASSHYTSLDMDMTSLCDKTTHHSMLKPTERSDACDALSNAAGTQQLSSPLDMNMTSLCDKTTHHSMMKPTENSKRSDACDVSTPFSNAGVTQQPNSHYTLLDMNMTSLCDKTTHHSMMKPTENSKRSDACDVSTPFSNAGVAQQPNSHYTLLDMNMTSLYDKTTRHSMMIPCSNTVDMSHTSISLPKGSFTEVNEISMEMESVAEASPGNNPSFENHVSNISNISLLDVTEESVASSKQLSSSDNKVQQSLQIQKTPSLRIARSPLPKMTIRRELLPLALPAIDTPDVVLDDQPAMVEPVSCLCLPPELSRVEHSILLTQSMAVSPTGMDKFLVAAERVEELAPEHLNCTFTISRNEEDVSVPSLEEEDQANKTTMSSDKATTSSDTATTSSDTGDKTTTSTDTADKTTMSTDTAADKTSDRMFLTHLKELLKRLLQIKEVLLQQIKSGCEAELLDAWERILKSTHNCLMGVNLLIEYSRQSGIQSDDCPADKCYTAPTNHSLKFETVEDQLQSALDLCREIKALQSIVNATLKSAASLFKWNLHKWATQLVEIELTHPALAIHLTLESVKEKKTGINPMAVVSAEIVRCQDEKKVKLHVLPCGSTDQIPQMILHLVTTGQTL